MPLDELKFDDAVATLMRYSLMTVADASLSVHRLVQTVTRDRLSDEEREGWAEAAARLVNEAFPYDSDDVRTWPECSLLLPHALAAAEHAKGLGMAPKATGRLLNQVGGYLRGRAEFGVAKSAHERALEIGERAYGPDHPDVAIRVNNLGSVLQAQGDLEGAKKCTERALGIFRDKLGEDHPNTMTVRNNLDAVEREIGGEG
ncbi:MAG: tetratricopeptide repeat protein [Euryarchaeota archaeon]|nr:tetratricopeptide repeat protein [Euryarchaeota archaeon]